MNLSKLVLDVSLKLAEAKKLLHEALNCESEEKELKVLRAIDLLDEAKNLIFG